jgi:hypothetical protein
MQHTVTRRRKRGFAERLHEMREHHRAAKAREDRRRERRCPEVVYHAELGWTGPVSPNDPILAMLREEERARS